MIDFRQVSIFASLTDEELALIQQHAKPLSYKKNTVIFTEGDNPGSMYVIESGRCKVSLTDEDGKEIILNDLRSGSYFGELGILDNEPRSASIETVTDCRLYSIPRESINKLMQNPATARRIIHELAERIRDLSLKVRNIALKDVYNNIVDLITSKAVENNGKLMVDETLTHDNIAKHFGCARESVTRIITQLKAGGYISYMDNFIVIEKKFPEKY